VNPESTWRLYSALASAAGVRRPVRVDDPRVLAARLRTARGERALFVNCSSEAIDAVPVVDGRLDPPLDRLALEPFGVSAPRMAAPTATQTRRDAPRMTRHALGRK
jgi:hypothetical protein